MLLVSYAWFLPLLFFIIASLSSDLQRKILFYNITMISSLCVLLIPLILFLILNSFSNTVRLDFSVTVIIIEVVLLIFSYLLKGINTGNI